MKKICFFIIFLLFVLMLYILFNIRHNEMNLEYDTTFIERSFNLHNVMNCVYTGRIVGNPYSIGPCDYEYFAFIKCSDEEIVKIKNKYKFIIKEPEFGVSPTPGQKNIENFNDKNMLNGNDFCWCYSSEFETDVTQNSGYIGNVYFDTINGYIYMWFSTF